jgi:hypothetical protein
MQRTLVFSLLSRGEKQQSFHVPEAIEKPKFHKEVAIAKILNAPSIKRIIRINNIRRGTL